MRWRRAMRKGGKWVGLVACAVMVAVWVGSAWWVAQLGLLGRGRVLGVGIRPGRVIFDCHRDPREPQWGFTVNRVPPRTHMPLIWMPELEHYGLGDAVHVPLHIPVLLAAVPTWLLWRADRRAARRERVGRCSTCGYDRRGIAADAMCPECGTVPAPGKT